MTTTNKLAAKDQTIIADLRARYPLEDCVVEVGNRLWKLTAAPDLEPMFNSISTNEELDNFPYGMALWPSAIGLAEYIWDQREFVCGKSVLELGCGVGLAGLVASHGGGIVTQTDYLPDILSLAQHNANANQVRTKIGALDWRTFESGQRFDLVIGADVLYERALHHDLITLFPKLLMPGGVIWISDPQRPASIDFFDQCDSAGWKTGIEHRKVYWQGTQKDIVIFTPRCLIKNLTEALSLPHE